MKRRTFFAAGVAVLTGAAYPGDESPRPLVSADDPRVRKAIAVQERNDRKLLKLPAAVGTGVGLSRSDPDTVVVQVFVSRPLKQRERRRYPTQVEGVPVDVIVTGEFRPQEPAAKPQ